jgi:PAS domain S-box-containing protein
VTRDVTESKRAEASLRENELKYKEVFDNAPQCIFLMDVTPDGRFKCVGLNPAEEKAIGFLSSEVAGKFVEDFLPEKAARRALPHYRQCVESGAIMTYEEELDLPTGIRGFHTTLTPLRNSAGRVYRIIGCCLDITDLKRTQQETLARQKLESIGVLAGGIAHDFNNLLGSILAQAELALTNVAAGASTGAEIEQIKAVALRASEIVRELMIYAGQEAANLEPLDVSHLVDEMIQLLRVSISKQAILKTDFGQNLPRIRGNAAQMRQVVMNLITNASEAIGERNGVIHVSTELVKLPEAEFLRLEVSDTGCGMTPETQAKIFEPFFSTKFAGRGLGLAVVQGIVRSHGGAIILKSRPGQGTRVQIFLPTAGPAAPQIRSAEAVSSGKKTSGRPGTVLLVEDEESLRVAVSKMLRKKGFSILEAADGGASLDLLRSHQTTIDLVLLDATITGASSREVIAEVQRIRPEMKIILMSAYSSVMAMPSPSAPQIKAFIRKPFQVAELVQLLTDTLSS